MQINATCPQCKTDYFLDRAMVGKHMRCPNSLCGTIFEVQDAEEPSPATESVAEKPLPKPTEKKATSKHVADVVPILTAQPATAPQPAVQETAMPSKPDDDETKKTPLVEKPKETTPPPESKPSWQNAPPPVRDKTESSAATIAADVAEPDADLDDLLFPSEAAVDATSGEQDESTAPWRMVRPKKRKSRASWIIVGLVLLMAGGVSMTWLSMRSEKAGGEDERYQKALAFYKDGDFTEALARFQRLHRDFPQSARQHEYRMLAELSDVRETVYQSQENADATAKSLGRFLQFLKMYENEKAFQRHQAEAWDTLHRLHKELLRWAKQDEDRTLLALAQRALTEAKQFPAPDDVNPKHEYRIAGAAIAELESVLAKNEKRGSLLDRIRQMAKTPTASVVQTVRRLVRKTGTNDDPEFQEIVAQIVKAHQASVTYVRSVGPAPVTNHDETPSLLINPLHGDTARELPTSKGVVFALARGLLLALEPKTGAVRWAKRVGVDTTELPVRLPPTDVSPETLLVLSTDRRTISALNVADGDAIWTSPLSGPCLCRPVLINHHVFVPTYNGRIDEFERTGGRLLGSFDVGQSISIGAAHQPGSQYLYVAADQFCVYVLDVVKRTCTTVLYTNHPSGSLRSPPIILQNSAATSFELSKKETKGVLVLLQAVGLNDMTTRLFALPIRDPDQPALKLKLKFDGWSWFQPFTDGERMAVATDAGEMRLLGVRLKGNTDPLLFPMTGTQQISVERRREGRSQVVHVDGDDYWVLAHRKLHRLQCTFKDKTGPQMLDRWLSSPVLGDPLHRAQTLNDNGSHVLFPVTADSKNATCWACAVDGETGRVLWKRQLGWLPRGNLISWKSVVWGYDEHGLYRFAEKSKTKSGPAQWNRRSFTRFARTGAHGRTFWLTDDGESTLFAAAEETSDGSHALRVRSFNTDGSQRRSLQVTLPASLAGRPARAKQIIVAPLSDGALRRIDVAQGTVNPGANWRSTQAEPDATANVVHVGGADFLVTDGHSRLQWLHWPKHNRWEKKGERDFTFSIVSAPVVLSTEPGEPPRICVADAANNVHLLQGRRMRSVRKWRLSGNITAGPFALGGSIAVIVRNRRLVWMNPDRDAPAWEYSFLADIVGRPLWTDKHVIVATSAGKFIALSDDAGRLAEWEHTIQADLEPVAGPMLYGNDRLFTPLSDGTVMLVPFQLQRK